MITIQKFGELPSGEDIHAYTLRSPNGMRARFLNYGATLQSFCLPNGQDIVLGFDDLAPYLENHGYMGAAIGRVSNRIENAAFKIDGKTYQVCANENRQVLHSGPDGFDRINWQAEIEGQALIFRHVSPQGHQGYPGRLTCEFRYVLDDQGLRLDMHATTNAPTPVSLTAHHYFNLGGSNIKNHALSLRAQEVYPVNQDGIPTAKQAIENTHFDFKASRKVGETEIDNHFTTAGTRLKQMATLFSPDGDIRLRVLSDLPGLQIYTAHKIEQMRGKKDRVYGPFAGITFEPQYPPNCINGPNSEDVILRPGKVWAKSILYNVETLSLKDS